MGTCIRKRLLNRVLFSRKGSEPSVQNLNFIFQRIKRRIYASGALERIAAIPSP